MNQESQKTGETPEKHRLGQRLEELALAIFLVMSGGLWLAPDAWVPDGAWLAGAGLILLGLNAARSLNGLPLSGFGIVAGVAALAAGGGRILGREHLFVPMLLIFLGAFMIVKATARSGNTDGSVRSSYGG
jgi:hypothetical protein